MDNFLATSCFEVHKLKLDMEKLGIQFAVEDLQQWFSTEVCTDLGWGVHGTLLVVHTKNSTLGVHSNILVVQRAISLWNNCYN